MAVLDSLVEDEPFHSSNIASDIADDTSMADCLSERVSLSEKKVYLSFFSSELIKNGRLAQNNDREKKRK